MVSNLRCYKGVLDFLVIRLTSGMIGGDRVIFLRPSQLNPSNHLRFREKQFTFMLDHCQGLFSGTFSNVFLEGLTCAFGCP